MSITGADVHATVVAGRSWVIDRDIPDPIAWADYGFDPELTATLINERRERGTTVSAAHHFPHPKGYALSANRWLTSVDPLDEIAYRIAVGRIAETLDDSLGSQVLSYRLRSSGPGWTVGNWRYGMKVRRSRIAATMGDSFLGVGVLDVSNYYPSIALEVLRGVVSELAVPDSESNDLFMMLHAWQDDWNVRGVPVGPEASGLIGNVMLMPVDDVVSRRSSLFTRYTDDYLVSIGPRDFPELVHAVTAALSELSLSLNESKVRHHAEGSKALLALFDPAIEDLAHALRLDRERGVALVRDAIESEAHAEVPDEKRFRWCINVLINRSDPFALSLFEANPLLARINPPGFGSYLARLLKTGSVDPEWLVSLVVAEPTPDTASLQLHAALACAQARLPKSLAALTKDLALTPGSYVPLRCAAVRLWAASESGKPGQVLDAAIDVGTPQHRRSLIAAAGHWPDSRKRRAGLTKLRAVAPEARATIEWVATDRRVAA